MICCNFITLYKEVMKQELRYRERYDLLQHACGLKMMEWIKVTIPRTV